MSCMQGKCSVRVMGNLINIEEIIARFDDMRMRTFVRCAEGKE
jgi:hypothetical protein